MKIDTAIIPLAGLGTRMLPASKAIPKEMLPILSKPIIQFIIEEVELAGFQNVIFITHSSKNSIENHFDVSFELESTLEKRLKRSSLKELREINHRRINISSIRQGEPKGLGHAILSASSFVENKNFAVILPDMIIDGNTKNNNLSLMKKNFEKTGIPCLLLSKAEKKELVNYGVVKYSKNNSSEEFQLISQIIEKPSLSSIPSDYYAIGRYIFREDFIGYLKKVKPDKNGELQLSDGISMYLKDKKDLLASKLCGKVFDCGNQLGYFRAILNFASKDKRLKKEISNFSKL